MSMHTVRFIHCVDPSAGLPAEAQRQSRSHAARIAHARSRQLRTARYQSLTAEKDTGQPKEGLAANSQTGHTVPAAQKALARWSPAFSPSPVNLPSSDPIDPFSSLPFTFKRVDSFLLYHYVQALQTCTPMAHMRCGNIMDMHNRVRRSGTEWVRMLQADAGFYQGVILLACRHLAWNDYHAPYFTQLAAEYKVLCIQSLRKDLASDATASKDLIIAKMLALTFDEYVLDDFVTARRHIEAAAALTSLAGGSESLGSNGFLRDVLGRFIQDQRLRGLEPVPHLGS